MAKRIPPYLFETEPCSRCGGTGHYSRCQMYGTTCFKCSGRKQLLTKRAHKLYAAYQELKQALLGVAADRLKVGDRVWQEACFYGTYRAGWQTVLEARVDELNLPNHPKAYYLKLEKVGLGCSIDEVFLTPATPEQVAQLDAWLGARVGKGVVVNPATITNLKAGV